jgi:hypothetical protein
MGAGTVGTGDDAKDSGSDYANSDGVGSLEGGCGLQCLRGSGGPGSDGAGAGPANGFGELDFFGGGSG